MQIPINKEIRHYQEEIFLGLNLRQMICSGAAIAVAVAVYLGLTPLLGHETAGWVCIVAAAPIAAAGFFTYDCLTFEKFLFVVIDSTVIRNDWRLWKTENKYCKKRFCEQVAPKIILIKRIYFLTINTEIIFYTRFVFMKSSPSNHFIYNNKHHHCNDCKMFFKNFSKNFKHIFLKFY